MFPMTVTISNPAQLNALMAALNVAGIESPKTSPCAGHAVETAKEEAKGKATTTQAAEQKPETLTQMTAGEAEKALHGHANNPPDAPTYQATADAVTKLARTKGRDAAVAVLSKFGAGKLPDIQPHDFQKVIDACVEAAA